ncbi:BrnA antitoxin family protein [Novosphingopyxis sp.]|uniref:BrnA antitoxin family protein n=1 Tax=Novosphingopyxis sp. TaxID=2709690 RepID=UPI003B59592D
MTAPKKFSKKISDAEEARIQKLIASDPDAPEASDEQIADARPFAEAFPDLAVKIRNNAGGRPRSANPKQPISIRLDQDVIAKFKSTGPGWQSQINEALRRVKLPG